MDAGFRSLKTVSGEQRLCGLDADGVCDKARGRLLGFQASGFPDFRAVGLSGLL